MPEAILDTFSDLPFDKLLKLADAEAIAKVSPPAYNDAGFRNEGMDNPVSGSVVFGGAASGRTSSPTNQ